MVFLFGITASTFAWFKINSNASISGFEFKVQGGEGFKVSIDGKNYYSSLTHEQMIMAILKSYKPNYVIDNDTIYDSPTYDLDGNLVNLGSPMSLENRNKVFKDILLKPLTSTFEDGKLILKNFVGSKFTALSGQFVEFEIYFKSESAEGDNQSYSIYLLGENKSNPDTGENVLKTSIRTKTTGGGNVITLVKNMDAISNLNPSIDFADRTVGNFGPTPELGKEDKYLGTSINVYTANAIRFSIGNENDDNFKDKTDYVCSNQIYEISDDVAYDLGSYATDYDEYINDSNRNTSGAVYSALEHNLYDCRSNAQFTYYNNIKVTDQNPLPYEQMPITIRHLTTELENSTAGSPYENTLHYITTVNSGELAHKLTFRFWLEGFDADCFDGISQSIAVNLSFGSVKNN